MRLSTDELLMSIERIVVGHDGSPGARHALEWAAGLAHQLGAEVVVVRGYNPLDELGQAEPPVDFAVLEDAARRTLAADWCRPLADAGVPHRSMLIEDDAVSAIAQAVESERADLVVVGSHGRTGWRERILGSVATKLPHEVPCPVVIVPAHRAS
jgi:nucleotide-binding universal stress UspA family protein